MRATFDLATSGQNGQLGAGNNPAPPNTQRQTEQRLAKLRAHKDALELKALDRIIRLTTPFLKAIEAHSNFDTGETFGHGLKAIPILSDLMSYTDQIKAINSRLKESNSMRNK